MLNNKFLSIVKNFSYSLSSNLLSLIIASVVTLIIPKIIGIEEFGYWQIYLFYASYVGFLHFGWNDGIYLRYGGEEYDYLDKKKFFSQFWMLFLFQLMLSIIMFVITIFFVDIPNNRYIYEMVSLNLLVVNTRYMLVYVLQATNRIKDYSKSTILDRVFFITFIFIFIIMGIREFKYLIIADLIGKFISFLYTVLLCKDIVFRKISDFSLDFKEALSNIKSGINLMFGNIASTLIIGIIRFGIERIWSVVVFGKVSLTLNVSSLLMKFVNALSLVLYPILRRTKKENLKKIYAIIRTALMVPLVGLLIIYYPLKILLISWLPEYADGLEYMALLFPMILYESKISLLINTYLKTLRKEKMILWVNILTVILSIFFTFIFAYVQKNLTLTMISILLLLAFRCILAEKLLSKIINVDVNKDILLEVIMTILFIVTSWFMKPSLGIIVYVISYGVYLLIKRKNIIETYNNLKILMK